ncbi:hypothetical protein H5410_057051 [Solanum commersonii]|uniref:Uncharacterized protein n=1 Tax=Solanum commersonii TaxID=4109 RepID=A0A9J5WNJ9_SOLCO|nr:hypothetical protein H5410_057051 [Solanum commersonii]
MSLFMTNLEDAAVCFSIANVPHAKYQSIGTIIHYIVPIISKSDKMVGVKVRSRLTFYTFLAGVGGSNFGVGFEEPAAVVVAMTSTSLISKGTENVAEY